MRMDGYMSPISLNVERITQDIREQHEQNVLHAVMQCGIIVDRDELIKALSYDRDQYRKGFSDGCDFAQTWISVRDRLPEERQHVLTYVKFPEFAGFCAWECHMTNVWLGNGWAEDVTTSRGVITHWMPLPEPPKESEL